MACLLGNDYTAYSILYFSHPPPGGLSEPSWHGVSGLQARLVCFGRLLTCVLVSEVLDWQSGKQALRINGDLRYSAPT
jgi:hypothetical protein